jgi:hypothetical protein
VAAVEAALAAAVGQVVVVVLLAAAHRAAVVGVGVAAHHATMVCVRRPMVLPAQHQTMVGEAAGDQVVAGDQAAVAAQVAAECPGAACPAVGQAGHAWLRPCARRCAPKAQSSYRRS